MLKLYYHPISVNARRVWIALLEKGIPFERVWVQLDGDQLSPEFTALNPLQRIPVIEDDGLRVVESLAILDYLEAKYPTPALMPQDPPRVAIARMVAMATLTELQPATVLLTCPLVGVEVPEAKLTRSRETAAKVLQLFIELLADHPYFGGEALSLADIVAGTMVPGLAMFGISLEPYPTLQAWSERLAQRPSWQETTAAPEVVQAALPNIKVILERRS